jgi:hypothetical protein
VQPAPVDRAEAEPDALQPDLGADLGPQRGEGVGQKSSTSCASANWPCRSLSSNSGAIGDFRTSFHQVSVCGC